MRTLITILSLAVSVFGANERDVLHYDAPAKSSFGRKGIGYMQEALPMGNGRLGAMFSGGIDREHLLINEITLWMNAKRGSDEVAQSGTRKGAFRNTPVDAHDSSPAMAWAARSTALIMRGCAPQRHRCPDNASRI